MVTWSAKRNLLDSSGKIKIHSKNDKIGVYKIYLNMNTIPYPNRLGNLIYIGKSESRSVYKRLNDYLNTSITSNPSLTNYILSERYDIKVEITNCNKEERCQKIEKDELRKHMKKYGSLPICNRKNA
tara:strand:+ start:181 stop:561 length:381 start_codon:yes stop_codon:yes gene_type:complete